MASDSKQPFLRPQDARQAFEDSYKWHRPYVDPIEEQERLARNKPSPRIAPELPKITSGDLAAIIEKDPKRTIQQLATGLVTSKDNPEFAPIADVVHRSRLMPMYNRMGTALQKHWIMMQVAKAHGRSASYTFFTSTEGQLHTDFVIPYIKDIYGEKGKAYAPDSNVAFMRTWYQARDIDAIINREKAILAQDKTYESGWNLPLLATFKNEGGTSKPGELQSPAEREKGDANTGGFELIHAFQVGKGAEQYAFSPKFKDGANLRTKVNKDPRGALPLDFEYNSIDLSNPFGRGLVELCGGIQNLIDQQLQMYMFMSTYMQQPALQVWGGVNKATLKIRPNAIWDMGSNPNNKVERDQTDNVYINNFVANMQFLQAKLYALAGSSDNSIPAASGNVGQSKTSQGVKATNVEKGVTDNHSEKQHEAWFQAQAETSLNVFFAEMSAEETIDIGKQDVKALKGSLAEKYISKSGDKLTIPYKDISNVTFKMKVDAGSSKDQDDADQLVHLKEISDEFNANPLVISWTLGQDGKKLSGGELMRQRYERMGLKNLDLILTDMSPEEAQAAQQAPFPIVDKPQVRVNTADLTADQITAVLQEAGVNLPPQQALPQPGQPPAGLSPQGVADFIVEMTKAQALAQAKTPAAPDEGMSVEELAMKHTEFDQKQQELDRKEKELQLNAQKHEADTVLKADKQAHDNTLALAQHLHTEGQAEVGNMQADRSQTFTEKQAKLAPKKPVGAAK